MEVLSLLISPIIEIFKCGSRPLVRRIGYLVHYKRNVEKLTKKVEELRNTRADVQQRVDAARRNLESIRRVVEAWLERVDMEAIERLILNSGDAVEMINHQCCRGWCCFCARYHLGREAEKQILKINELLSEGKDFGTDVSNPSSPLGIEFMPATKDFEAFASRKLTTERVMAALKDERTYLIGVYGMGGVGKTTLMNQVSKQVMEEKLFDVLVMTTVSQNVDLKRIQVEIANQLGLRQLQEVDIESTRTAMLSARLKQEKSILVILDDLWSTTDLNFSDLGIPEGETSNHHKGCKVVITTRSVDVCSSMSTQKEIEIRVLKEEESWNLFKQNAGEVVDSPSLQVVARKVAEECGGLPIALVTLGRALRNKDKHVWEDTALQLERSNFTYIEGMNSKVFSSIKLSYDHLGNKMIRNCFLFCCLFPEVYEISFDELMMHVMGEGILEDVETLKQARGRLHTVLNKLVASCLLLGDKQQHNVRMHDIVRDVGIAIASEEDNGFYIRAGVDSKNWPIGSRIGKCLRLSLMKNKISELPDQPELPHLLSLSLGENESLKEIPDSFFQRMKALATLDLSKTGISSLPSSLSCLANLYTLCLDHCAFDESIDISLIGKLKNLEILSLVNCNLHKLPEEMGGLTNLKLLDLSRNEKLEIIPSNVISSLSHLEELYMMKSFNGWEIEGWGNGSSASLAEVVSLPCLTTLELGLRKQTSTEDLDNGRIVLLNVSIGCRNERMRIQFPDLDLDCDLTASPPVAHSIMVLLERLDNLVLRNCIGLKSIAQLIAGDGFRNMKSLSVENCNEMEYLLSTTVVEEEIPARTTIFVALEKLSFYSMNKMKEIFHGPIPVGFLDKLKRLYLKECNDITSIFVGDLVKRVPHLEELTVENCCMLKDVFQLELEGSSVVVDDQEGTSTVSTFSSKLREMFLMNLPVLETIWKGVIPVGYLENLQVMEVNGCDGLRYLFSPAMAHHSFQQLEYLWIINCKRMVKIIAISEEMVEDQGLVLVFPKLKFLNIRQCPNMKRLFRPLMSVAPDNKLVLPHLSWLYLIDLPKLSSCFDQAEWSVLNWPSLRDLTVARCENLKRLPFTHQSAPQLEKIVGDSEEWFQELEWDDPIVKLNLQPLFKAADAEDNVKKSFYPKSAAISKWSVYFSWHKFLGTPITM